MLKAEDVSYAHLPEAPEGTPPEAARAGDLVFYAGGMAAHPATGIAPEIYPHPELPNHWSHIRAQLMHIYGRMGLALESLGSSMRDSLKINTYQTRLEETFDALNLREDYFGGEAPPPSTLVYVPALAVPRPDRHHRPHCRRVGRRARPRRGHHLHGRRPDSAVGAGVRPPYLHQGHARRRVHLHRGSHQQHPPLDPRRRGARAP